MEKDFQSAPKRFWQTIRRLRRGKRGSIQAVYSIKPATHSKGMFSWFPILFPLKQPIPLSRTDDVTVRFWRCNNGKKVWYEWAVTEPSCSAIHNPAGRSYTIGL
ncbi:hypothetical protein NHX12_004549 [Muraenolepis orangiensis]|uniref:PRMT5 oligomerisation domain-containing protein n=1 Tax=Muraenolepis orangiensis TaxID=630683 RepID=A0A9Q0DUN5_9TELE|nr:hypothetical protein NHX12_004549 [Muraenolepis orangiensis]